ncbi:hypothetical protein BC834DRAFT_972615 [Gloeopeniophorella convolvens]|nr:hypothetical protein BC834DRAFT_972615 [Gloeopeniophorella convolvens]
MRTITYHQDVTAPPAVDPNPTQSASRARKPSKKQAQLIEEQLSAEERRAAIAAAVAAKAQNKGKKRRKQPQVNPAAVNPPFTTSTVAPPKKMPVARPLAAAPPPANLVRRDTRVPLPSGVITSNQAAAIIFGTPAATAPRASTAVVNAGTGNWVLDQDMIDPALLEEEGRPNATAQHPMLYEGSSGDDEDGTEGDNNDNDDNDGEDDEDEDNINVQQYYDEEQPELVLYEDQAELDLTTPARDRKDVSD